LLTEVQQAEVVKTEKKRRQQGMWVEFGCVGASAVLWGSTFVPTKEFPVGDGFYYQWIMALGIWLVGLIANLVLDSPPFQPIAMLGGVVWATGACPSPPHCTTSSSCPAR
jgi:hypothetical protein